MQNKRNYYRLLNVQFDAPPAVIKASYRTMMQKMKMHPDLGGNEEQAMLLNEALETLLDEHRRARYDEALKQSQPAIFSQRQGSSKRNAQRPTESAENNAPAEDNRDSLDRLRCSFCGNESGVVRRQSHGWSQSARCSCCDAPLSRVKVQPVLVDRDQRQVQRMDFSSSVLVKTAWPNGENISAEVQDFSTKGARLRSQISLDEGQIMLLSAAYFDAVCIVRHVAQELDGSWLTGVEFKTLETRMPPGQLFSVTA